MTAPFVSFTIPGSPVGLNATYLVGRSGWKSRMRLSPGARDYRKGIADRAALAMGRTRPTLADVGVSLEIHYPSRRADIDGPIKGLLDALQGVVYRNDRQVRALAVTADVDKAAPRIVVTVWEIGQ